MKTEEKIDIDSLKAGRELDALVAEKVMGLEVIRRDDGKPHYLNMPYSTSILAAWDVVEKMSWYEDKPQSWYVEGVGNAYAALFTRGELKFRSSGRLAPMAICLAALKCVLDKQP